MELKKDSTLQKSNLVSLVLVVKSTDSKKINAKLQFILPKGFKNLGSEGLAIEMLPEETRHIPLKLLVSEGAEAGASVLICNLIDTSGVVIGSASTTHFIDINNTLSITPLENTIYRLSNNEPIVLKIKVSNKGNIPQNVTLVCRFPDPTNTTLFIEQNANIAVKKDSIFTFTYLPSKNVAKQSNYLVRISGFRNPAKEIFGNTAILIQNISSEQQYQAVDFTNFSEETQNQISSSYRKVGNGLDFYQLKGSGGFNIPSGYLLLQGNIALSNSQQIPLVTNTSLTFHQENNQYTIGSINKLLEMTLVGRGAEYSYTFENKQQIELGFVDQNYNLIEKNSWLKYGYGFYAKGNIPLKNSSQIISGNYVYRYDPFEKAKHNVVGTEVSYNFKQDWKFNAKLNGGFSLYDGQDYLKPSFGAESNYIGKIKNFTINGNYFYSTDYYPGNRRGSTLLQQSISTDLNNNNLHANVIVSEFSPKYHSFETEQESSNTRLELGNRFPKFRNFTFSLLYQYQAENSNSYNALFGNYGTIAPQYMRANRIIEQASWVNNSTRQSAVLGLETGMVTYPMQIENQFQMKLNANYSFRNFNFNSNFQSGSYYLSEYVFSRIAGRNVNYEKLNISLFYTNNFIKDKVNMSSGVSYVKDIIYGKSPSAFFNAKYNNKTFSTFFNSSWYNYSSGARTKNSMTFEVGITVNLQKTVLNPHKKSTIKAKVFYDTNNNNRYDAGEKYASNYTININKIALQTDNDGMATYQNVPYDAYVLKQFIQDGWYYDDTTFNVNQHVYNLSIPLHQGGKMEGKVHFEYNSKTALEFEHRGSGISFSVLKDGQLAQKIQTDDQGKFTAFLPTGKYTILINEKSLPANTFCEILTHEIHLKAGEIVYVPEFVIKVREKKINTKKFFN